jgi:RNA polymerase sigma-70 factor (ECF subfamily)
MEAEVQEAAPAPEILSDEDVVDRVREGEVDLFETLMRRYNQRLYRIARSVVRDDPGAEDVVQEAWVRAYTHLDQFERRARFSTWLARIAIHEAWARARRGRRFVSIEPERANPMTDPVSRESDPEKTAADRESASVLEAAIAALPDLYRGVLVLRDVEELSTAETAECLELTEEAVKTRLHRARGLLRRELAGTMRAGVYPFLGARCDRMVAAVFARIRPGTSARANSKAAEKRRGAGRPGLTWP